MRIELVALQEKFELIVTKSPDTKHCVEVIKVLIKGIT